MSIEIIEYKNIISEIGSLKKATLFLGNGASISLSNKFSYKSLFDKAIGENVISTNLKAVFDQFETCNFEEILNNFEIAYKINATLQKADKSLSLYNINDQIIDYQNLVKEALISTVREIHPIWSSLNIVQDNRDGYLSRFLTQFRYIISLNYDLLLYYIIQKEHASFCDGFGYNKDNSALRFNAARFKSADMKNRTHVYYPHGNLVLGINKYGEEFKIFNKDESGLLEQIYLMWEKMECLPLFICEGTSQKKKASITRNYYLSHVYRNILSNLTNNIIIYGWSFSDNDTHILEKLVEKNYKKLYISVYMPTGRNDVIDQNCLGIKNKIKEVNSTTEVFFFDSNDEMCWLNYRDSKEAKRMFSGNISF